MKNGISIFFLLVGATVGCDLPSSLVTKGSPSKEVVEVGIRSAVDPILTRLSTTRNAIEKLLANSSVQPRYPAHIYFRNRPTETVSDHDHVADSNFFLSYRKPIDASVSSIRAVSESFEDVFRENKRAMPALGWQTYLDFATSGLRVFPWFDVDTFLGNEIDWSVFSFFTLTREQKDPRGLICTQPSLDVAGLGFISTCSAQVFLRDKPSGIVSFDVSIGQTFVDVRPKLGKDLKSFMVLLSSKTGHVVLTPDFWPFIFGNVVSRKDISFQSDTVALLNDRRFSYTSGVVSAGPFSFDYLVFREI